MVSDERSIVIGEFGTCGFLLARMAHVYKTVT